MQNPPTKQEKNKEKQRGGGTHRLAGLEASVDARDEARDEARDDEATKDLHTRKEVHGVVRVDSEPKLLIHWNSLGNEVR